MKIAKYFKRILLAFLVVTAPFALYLFFATITSLITLGEYKDRGAYTVYISSGLIHTEFVFDTAHSPYEWRSFLPAQLVTGKSVAGRFLSIGWGDKRFYYELLDWNDLTFDLAFSAVVTPSKSAVHAEYSSGLNPDLKYYKLKIDAADYMKLVNFIQDSFELDAGKPVKIDNFNYFNQDAFFWGKGHYHMFNTCNMWTVQGLREINARRPLWSPFKWGVEMSL